MIGWQSGTQYWFSFLPTDSGLKGLNTLFGEGGLGVQSRGLLCWKMKISEGNEFSKLIWGRFKMMRIRVHNCAIFTKMMRIRITVLYSQNDADHQHCSYDENVQSCQFYKNDAVSGETEIRISSWYLCEIVSDFHIASWTNSCSISVSPIHFIYFLTVYDDNVQRCDIYKIKQLYKLVIPCKPYLETTAFCSACVNSLGRCLWK